MKKKRNIIYGFTACLCVISLVSCTTQMTEENYQHLTDTNNTGTTNSYEQAPDNTLLTIDDLHPMTGEDIRIAFLRGEIYAQDMFLSSDTTYINTQLNELFQHYTEQPNALFAYPNYESAPNGIDFSDPFSLANCEIISYDTRSQYPVQLKFEVGDYDLFIGFEPWDIDIKTSNDLANIQWHPNIAYFMPISDDILQPYAQFGNIRIYIQSDTDHIQKSLKAIDISTGYSIYPSALAYHLHDLDNLTIQHNGTNMVAIQLGNEQFTVLDFSGNLYYNQNVLFMTPYLNYYSNQQDDYLVDTIHWIDEHTLEAVTEKGIFHFTMNSYQSIEIHDDGTFEITNQPGPIKYIE